MSASSERLERLMPELLAEMRHEVAASPFIREFVVYKKGLSFWNGGTAFEYTSPDEAIADITSKNQAIPVAPTSANRIADRVG